MQAKYGVSEVKRLEDLEEKNRRLKIGPPERLDYQVVSQWIDPGKPAQNAYIERFNRTVRRDVLNASTFNNLAQTRRTVDAWLMEYNTERPHQLLKIMTSVNKGGLNSSQNWFTK